MILIVEGESSNRDLLHGILTARGHRVQLASNASEARQWLENGHSIELVVCDFHLSGEAALSHAPKRIFTSKDSSLEFVERSVALGALDVIHKPFDRAQVESVVERVLSIERNSIRELMAIVSRVSGVQLPEQKLSVVETRVLRRCRELGLASLNEYLEYFQARRRQETTELISLLTTHTTEFFREAEHFDTFFEESLPALVKPGARLKFVSVACSTGQEVYSLAMTFLEFLRIRNIQLHLLESVEFIGSDVDLKSIEIASAGVYPKRLVADLPPTLVERYFDLGEGAREEWVQLKDRVHGLCRFEKGNLLDRDPGFTDADVVFARNVFIYFNSSNTSRIAQSLARGLKAGGFLFLGHSESLLGLETPFELQGNSVYRLKRQSAPTASSAQAVVSRPRLTRVLIVDDSLTIRKALRYLLSPESGFEVVGEAGDPIEAQAILNARPGQIDLITLDIHMPRMDGMTFLHQLGKGDHPPVVMISSVSKEDATEALRCLELGAVDYIEKPRFGMIGEESIRLRAVLKQAAMSRMHTATATVETDKPELSYQVTTQTDSQLILLGASTGGTEAIRRVLQRFPKETPPILIVQHIPAKFSAAFARRLNELCPFPVIEATHRLRALPNHAYVAPGGMQMSLNGRPGEWVIEVTDAAPVNRHKPSVDHLFDSVAALAIKDELQITAALLTGMGEDGAQGLKNLRNRGAYTIAQDEETCVVYGMPREAVIRGAAVDVLALSRIPDFIFRALSARRKAA